MAKTKVKTLAKDSDRNKLNQAIAKQHNQAIENVWEGEDEGALFDLASNNKALEGFNRRTAGKNMYTWVKYLQLNTRRVHRDYQRTHGKCDMLNFTRDLFEARSLALVGSGPSLDQSVEYLKYYTGPIICGLTAAPTLIAHGVIPTAIMVVDSHDLMVKYATYVPMHQLGIKLLTTPAVHPELLRMWPSNVYYFLFYALGNTQKGNNAYNHLHSYMYPMVATKYAPTGCVNDQLLILAADIQRWLGTVLQPISLWGFDFAYSLEWTDTDGNKHLKPHCNYYKYMDPRFQATGLFFPWQTLDPSLFLLVEKTQVSKATKVIKDEATGYPTSPVLMMGARSFVDYLKDLENQAKNGVGMPMHFANVSRGLLDKVLPAASDYALGLGNDIKGWT